MGRMKRRKNILKYLEDVCGLCGIHPDDVQSIKIGSFCTEELCSYGTVLLYDGRRIIFTTEAYFGTDIKYIHVLEKQSRASSIRYLKALGFKQICIANFLEVSQSTVSKYWNEGDKDGKADKG